MESEILAQYSYGAFTVITFVGGLRYTKVDHKVTLHSQVYKWTQEHLLLKTIESKRHISEEIFLRFPVAAKGTNILVQYTQSDYDTASSLIQTRTRHIYIISQKLWRCWPSSAFIFCMQNQPSCSLCWCQSSDRKKIMAIKSLQKRRKD